MHDAELLSRYVNGRDEGAFREFVARYVNLVFSIALRRLHGDAAAAEEVTQAVFLLAARNARALRHHPALAGWLYRTAWQTAENARRSELRRKLREREAAQMNIADESQFKEVLPLLDEAMQQLPEPERLVLLSRFFLKRSMRELGTALGISEAAAKMRVSRALDQLRKIFARRGVVCSAALLGIILEERAVQAAPAVLSTSIANNIAHAGVAGAVSSFFAKTLIFMSYTKPVKIGIAALLFALLGSGVYEYQIGASRRKANSATVQQTAPANPAGKTRTGRANARATQGTSGADSMTAALDRLRAAVAAPVPKSGQVWPSQQVIEAIQAVPDKKAAFETLKGAIAHPEDLFTGNLGVGDPAGMVRDRAISAMEYLAPDLPEVKPYLLDLVQKREDTLVALHAVLELRRIGMASEDLPKIIERLPDLNRSPAGRRFVPEALADVIAADPQASAPAISSLQELLSSEDEKLRLSAACALATSRLDDARVASLLADPLTNSDKFAARVSMEALAKAGPKAAQFVPALLALANSTTDEHLRRETLLAIATIQPAATETNPAVASVTAADTSEREIGERLDNGGASIDDLMAALRLPKYATQAAARIGELGPYAVKTVPLLRAALEGRDEDARDQILDAIHKVAPDVTIEKVEAKTISNALLSTDISLGPKGNNYEDPVTKLVMERRAFSTWWTRDELVGFAKRLNALDPAVAQTFISNIVERDPAMKELLAAAVH